MIVKIEQIGKYFKVTRVEDNIRLINSPTKEIRYIPQNGLYYFYDNEGNKLLGELDGILWDDFRDSNGDAFADENTLIDFLDNNTGFNTPGATGEELEALDKKTVKSVLEGEPIGAFKIPNIVYMYEDDFTIAKVNETLNESTTYITYKRELDA